MILRLPRFTDQLPLAQVSNRLVLPPHVFPLPLLPLLHLEVPVERLVDVAVRLVSAGAGAAESCVGPGTSGALGGAERGPASVRSALPRGGRRRAPVAVRRWMPRRRRRSPLSPPLPSPSSPPSPQYYSVIVLKHCSSTIILHTAV